MSKISDKVSENLESAVEEALDTMGIEVDNNKEEIETKPKRKRRTKAEMQEEREAIERKQKELESKIIRCNEDTHIIATVEWDSDDQSNIPNKVEIPDSILKDDYNLDTISNWLSNTSGYCHKGFTLEWPNNHKNLEEFCQWEKEKAHIKGYEEPDFDFRDSYSTGEKVFLVRVYDNYKEKEFIEMTLRTVYTRDMVGVVDKKYCQMVGFNERDNLFTNKQHARSFYNSISFTAKDSYIDVDDDTDDVDTEDNIEDNDTEEQV
jgi:hypothetical protein